MIPMESFAELKVKGGKLVGVRLKHEGKITAIKIIGDFFVYPEEALYKIEDAIVGIDAHSKREEIVKRISKVVSDERAELIGLDPDAIADVICAAVSG
jgi:lipoate-protein ligase A